MSMPLTQSAICPILIGRVAQLAALADLLTHTASGQSRIALIAGEAGIGKSRLVAEVKTSAAQCGVTILQGHCFEQDRTFPYAPLLDLLRAFGAHRSTDELKQAFGPTAAELVKWFPELTSWLPDVQPTPALDPEHEKRRIFQAFTEFLACVPAPSHTSLLVILEDLHWCDDASLEWLLYFARRIISLPVLLLLTYRDDEVHASLSHFLAGLDRERLATELALNRLGKAEVDAMIQAIFELGRPTYAEFLEPVYALTDGNPFFLEEVLKSLMAVGDIFYADGRWTRKPMSEVRIPRSVQDAVQRRVAQLSAGARDMLTLAAVIGRRFDFVLLQRLTDLEERELLRRIKEALAAQLVVEESAEQFAFRHALTRQAIYAGLLARERKALHRTIAETMERADADTREASTADLAYHYYEAGDLAKALAYSRRAGDHAERLYAHDEALRHYERARECAEALNLPEQLAPVDEGMGDVYYARGEYPLAAEYLQRALSRTPAPEHRAALKARIGAAYAWDNDERGREFLEAALNEFNPETQVNELARATVWLGRYHWYRSQYTAAIELYQRARQSAEPLDDVDTVSLIYFLLASAHSVLLHFDQSVEWARQCVALGERKAYPIAVAYGYLMLSQSFGNVGKWNDALDHATRYQHVSERIGAAVWLAWADHYRCLALHGQGDLIGAAEAARAALAQAQELRNNRLAINALVELVLIETELGNEGAAHAYAERALSRADALRDVGLQSACRQHLAHLHVQREEWESALALFDQCAALLTGTESHYEMMLMGADRAEACIGLGRLDEAATIIAESLAIAREAHARHYEAVARRVQGQILAAQQRWDDAARAFDEAIATLDQNGSRLELARALYHRGALYWAMQNADAARADWTRARELFQATGARPMLWRTHGALGQLAQAQKRDDQVEREFAAARAIVEELAANMGDDMLREQLLQRAAKVLPPVRPLTPRRAAQREFGGLTAREREVAALIAQGKTSRDIAETLVLSERTVEGHVGSMLSKLGFTSRAQIAAWAVEKGLVDGPTKVT